MWWFGLLGLVGVSGLWPFVAVFILSTVPALASLPDDVEFEGMDGQVGMAAAGPSPCLRLMARDGAMKPDWMMAATCAAVASREPRFCAPDDWVCLAVGALGGEVATCGSLPPGAGRRACLIVSRGAVPEGACLRSDDAASCAAEAGTAARGERAALNRLTEAWRARVDGDVRRLGRVCEAPPGGLEDKAAQCACLEWLREVAPSSSPRGCPRCEKSRGEAPLGRCPVRLTVNRKPEGDAEVANPWSSAMRCWADGKGHYRQARLEPGRSRTLDALVSELWCLPTLTR